MAEHRTLTFLATISPEALASIRHLLAHETQEFLEMITFTFEGLPVTFLDLVHLPEGRILAVTIMTQSDFAIVTTDENEPQSLPGYDLVSKISRDEENPSLAMTNALLVRLAQHVLEQDS